MKLGQTSVAHFGSQILGSFIGFLIMVFLARKLGSDILGVYFLALSLVSWLILPSTVGIKSAISKRLSENKDQDRVIVSGSIMIFSLAALTGIIVWIFRPLVNAYIGEQIASLVVLLVFAGSSTSLVKAILIGKHKVHLMGFLTPIETFIRGLLQIIVVLLGFGIFGILLAHLTGSLVIIGIGLFYISVVAAWPNLSDFRRLFSFAKFSWLGQVKGRTFNRMDIIILGLFIQSNLIGIYSISWNIASFLGIFSASISTTLFPEMSELSMNNKLQEVSELFEISISYAGLLHIPGFVGAFVLGDKILQIYGNEFVKGTNILVILVFAYLLNNYNQQILTLLNGVDRPDLAFRSNAALIISNILLNIILVYQFGWIGAAFATTISVGIGLVVGSIYMTKLIDFEIPITILCKQLFAALIMGIFVVWGRWSLNSLLELSNNMVSTLILISLGACLYFLILISISQKFRAVVHRNIQY